MWKAILKSLLWLFISLVLVTDLYQILEDLSILAYSYHQKALSVFFRSSFGLFELIMLALMVYFIRKYPERRKRLISLIFFHVTGILILPMATRDFTWMSLSYPWPQTFIAFDRLTSPVVFLMSIIISFLIIPAVTWKWGAKAYCGYICPHGAFYSESYGRLFRPSPGKINWLKKFGPPFYFILMSGALILILIDPETLEPIRRTQKLVFFCISQLFFLVIGIPVIGARSYCTHFCPLGYAIRGIIHLKRRKFPKQNGKLPNIRFTTF